MKLWTEHPLVGETKLSLTVSNMTVLVVHTWAMYRVGYTRETYPGGIYQGDLPGWYNPGVTTSAITQE